MLQFSVFLGVVFALEMVAGISAYLLQSEIHQLLERTISLTIEDSPHSNSSAHMMDVMQSEVKSNFVNYFFQYHSLQISNKHQIMNSIKFYSSMKGQS